MIGEKILCGLDVGTRQMKASLVKAKRPDQWELIATHELPTRGLRKSQVNDLSEFSESVHDTLRDLSKKSGAKIKDVQLGIGGELVTSRFSRAMIPLLDKSSKIVTQGDIKKINKQARLLGVKMEEEILHDFPQHYVLDDTNKVLTPLSLYGRKLGVMSLLIVAPTNPLGNIHKAVQQAGYEIAHIFFSSFVCAQASLTDDARQNGCLLIDMGANTTNILFFKDGFLRHLDIIPLGGDHFTGSIAQALQLPFELAEDIKKSHASVLSEDIHSSGEILIKKDEGYMSIKRKVIYESIEPQVARFIDDLQNTLRFSHIVEKLNSGAVMIGGGALLPGLIERVEKALGIHVSMGKPNMDTTAFNNASVFTAAIGLAQAGLNTSLPHIFSVNASRGWLGNFSNRIKELYEEYF